MEEVRPAIEGGGPLDILKARCSECGSRVDFQFDISSFFDSGADQFGLKEPNPGEEDDEGGWR